MILLKIKNPCDRYFSCSKVFCSKVKFTIVYYSKFSLGIYSFAILLYDMLHLSRSLFFIFQLLGECQYWWTNESQRAHVAKFFGQLLLIRSVLRASNIQLFLALLGHHYPNFEITLAKDD